MTFTDLKTFTYVGNRVIIDGVDREVVTCLAPEINAVQYHRGRDIIEEFFDGNLPSSQSKYQSVLDEWVEAGIEIVVEPTVEEQIENIKSGIQAHLDSQARVQGFDDINSIAKYIGIVNVYQSQAEQLAIKCANTWKYIEKELAKVEAKARTLPTLDEALLELSNAGI